MSRIKIVDKFRLIVPLRIYSFLENFNSRSKIELMKTPIIKPDSDSDSEPLLLRVHSYRSPNDNSLVTSNITLERIIPGKGIGHKKIKDRESLGGHEQAIELAKQYALKHSIPLILEKNDC